MPRKFKLGFVDLSKVHRRSPLMYIFKHCLFIDVAAGRPNRSGCSWWTVTVFSAPPACRSTFLWRPMSFTLLAVQGSTHGGCGACGRRGAVKILPIDNSLPSKAKEMFNNNEESLKKINDRLAFQLKHYKRAIEIYSKAQAQFSTKLKEQAMTVSGKRREVQEEEHRLREKEEMVNRLERAVKSLGGSSPGRSVGSGEDRRSVVSGEVRSVASGEGRRVVNSGGGRSVLPWQGVDARRGKGTGPMKPLF